MEELRKQFAEFGQDQVFHFYDELSRPEKENLGKQASEIDLPEVSKLIGQAIHPPTPQRDSVPEQLAPADFTPLPPKEVRDPRWIQARQTGEEALRAGRVCAFTVAGGQGTRLGFSGPKGTFGVTPVLKKSLFQVFAEKIIAANQRFETSIPWYILTSAINHGETTAFFESFDFFGLDRERVHFLVQGLLPAVDENGKILLAEKDSIALSPDGHGGSLRALVRSGAIDRMEAEGTDIISYFQVDNPLVRCIDPAFIGFHLLEKSQFSSKALPKSSPEEKVGVFCRHNHKSIVIEYSDLPEPLKNKRDEKGDLKFRGGSIAIHLLDRDFVGGLISRSDAGRQLPFHIARKAVDFVDTNGVKQTADPRKPNAFKFEMFVFDALPFAENPVIIETAREDEFSPVKNDVGADSIETSRNDQLRQFARWVRAAGIELETDKTGLPSVNFEVSPLFADTEEQFIQSWNQLAYQPEITEGLVLA